MTGIVCLFVLERTPPPRSGVMTQEACSLNGGGGGVGTAWGGGYVPLSVWGVSLIRQGGASTPAYTPAILRRIVTIPVFLLLLFLSPSPPLILPLFSSLFSSSLFPLTSLPPSLLSPFFFAFHLTTVALVTVPSRVRSLSPRLLQRLEHSGHEPHAWPPSSSPSTVTLRGGV